MLKVSKLTEKLRPSIISGLNETFLSVTCRVAGDRQHFKGDTDFIDQRLEQNDELTSVGKQKSDVKVYIWTISALLSSKDHTHFSFIHKLLRSTAVALSRMRC